MAEPQGWESPSRPGTKINHKGTGREVPASKAKTFHTDVFMRVGALLLERDERLAGSWRVSR